MKKFKQQIVNTLLAGLLLAAPATTATASDSDNLGAPATSFDILMYRGANRNINLNLATGQSKRVVVTLKDTQNEVVYQTYLKRSAKAYRLKFNFEDSKAGLYRFEISDGQRTIVRQVEVAEIPAVESHRYIVYNPHLNR